MHFNEDEQRMPARVKVSSLLGAMAGAALGVMVASLLPVAGTAALLATGASVAVFSAVGMLLGAHHLGYRGQSADEREQLRDVKDVIEHAQSPNLAPQKAVQTSPEQPLHSSITYASPAEEAPQTFHRKQLAAARALAEFDHTRAPRC